MEPSKGKAIASMILGITSCVCCFLSATVFFGIAGIVCGIIGLCFAVGERKKAEAAGVKPESMTTVGLITSIVGLALCAIFTVSCIACYSCGAANLAGLPEIANEIPWDDFRSLPDNFSEYFPQGYLPGV